MRSGRPWRVFRAANGEVSGACKPAKWSAIDVTRVFGRRAACAREPPFAV